MRVAKHKVVSFNYKLTDEQGRLLDSSEGHDPLMYLHGADNIIPGLEQALEGKATGDALAVTVPPEQAYGAKDEQLLQTLPRHLFRGVDQIELGMRFEMQNDQGRQIVTVVGQDKETVTVDGNHPLAGMTLNFEVHVTAVRDATAEEISHGHVHHGGHHE